MPLFFGFDISLAPAHPSLRVRAEVDNIQEQREVTERPLFVLPKDDPLLREKDARVLQDLKKPILLPLLNFYALIPFANANANQLLNGDIEDEAEPLLALNADEQVNGVCNLFNTTNAEPSWQVDTLKVMFTSCGIKRREAGADLTKVNLIRRLERVWFNEAAENEYEPTPFGRNVRGYWFPIFKEIIYSFLFVFGTIFIVQFLYEMSESYHHEWNCVSRREFYSMKCYAAKKCRTFFEETNYNMVYTALIGMGAAATRIATKHQQQFNKYFQ